MADIYKPNVLHWPCEWVQVIQDVIYQVGNLLWISLAESEKSKVNASHRRA